MTIRDVPRTFIMVFLALMVLLFGGLVSLVGKGPEAIAPTTYGTTYGEPIGAEGSSVLAEGNLDNEVGRTFDWKFFIVPLPEEYGGPLPCTWVQQTGMSCDYSRRRYQ